MTVAEKPIRIPRKLDIGAGAQKPANREWMTLDIVGTFRPDVLGSAYHLPFKDGSLEGIKCHHVLEHIPRDYFVFHWAPKADEFATDASGHVHLDGDDFAVIRAGSRSYIEARKGLVDVMNECWRVLEPDGQIWIEVPLFPTEEAIADPTHGSFLVSATFDYFLKCQAHSDDDGHLVLCREDHRRMYGIKPWKHVDKQRLNHARILGVVLEKIDE